MKGIAIVGAQCQFPGNFGSPDQFFRALLVKQDYCRDVPENRWNAERFANDQSAAGKTPVRRGHFIDYDYKRFDATAFGFAPREVEFIDPQQRLLLETAWEAMENAGIDHRTLAGTDVGVYVGGFTVDHLLNQFSSRCRSAIGQHSAAGATLTMLANRISYAFDFRGPSFSVDTACSSSLVAFAYAVEDIRQRRCETALVGGVNFMLRPEYVIAMSKGSFLAPDGRSKSFDAEADGYGRGEGCGVVILKDAEAAMADGDRILAFVDGAGVNQDGRTAGITVPNPDAQIALMSRVVADSCVDPGSIQYVEAHGTGTPVGDPLEARAISEVYGRIERAGRCAIGSVKSNIGHLEAAAGIAGIIKAAWMLQRNVIPPLLLHGTPNPAIPFDDYNLELVTRARPLAKDGALRRVAVNSFGYGGTNAHAILSLPQELPIVSHRRVPRSEGEDRRGPCSTLMVPVSAESKAALKGYALRVGDTLREASEADVGNVLYSNACRRTHHSQRAIVWGTTREEIISGLHGFARDESPVNVLQDTQANGTSKGTVFVYTGMGPQWWGMGRGLYRANPVYREAMHELDARFSRVAGFSILKEMLKDEGESEIERTELAQPANFALQYALTRALEAEGVIADAVVGHSVGEVASSWASGMLSLDEALLVSRERSRIQAKAAGQGAMLAVGLTPDEARERIASFADTVDIAAVNGATSVTLSGAARTLAELHDTLCAEEVFSRPLKVEVPYHSPAMEPLSAELIDCLETLCPAAPRVRLYSTVTGQAVTDDRYDGAYWARNVRRPVLFKDAIEATLDAGYLHFVEIGPHPVLSRSIGDIFRQRNSEGRLVSTLEMKSDDVESLHRAVARYYCAGGHVDWAGRHPHGKLVSLPNYPWDRQLLWREAEGQRADREDLGVRPFAESRAIPNSAFADLNGTRLNFLLDHCVDTAPVVPAAGYLEALLEAAETANPDARGWVLRDIAVHNALIQDRERGLTLETRRQGNGEKAEVLSYDELSGTDAQLHAVASLHPLADRSDGAAVSPAALQDQTPIPVEVTATYERFAQISLQYGDTFRVMDELRHNPDRTVAVVHLSVPEPLREAHEQFIAHPVLMDGSFQAALSLIDGDDGAYLPTRIEELRVLAPFPRQIWARVELTVRDRNQIACDIHYFDDEGRAIGRLDTLTCTALRRRDEILALPPVDYAYQWVETRECGVPGTTPITVVGESGDPFAARFVERCRAAGVLGGMTHWDAPDLEATLRKTVRPDGSPAAVALVCGCGVDGGDPLALLGAERVLETVKGFATTGPFSPRFYLLTRNAVATVPADAAVVPAQSALHILGRVVYNEVEETNFTVLDLDAERPDFDQCLGEMMEGNEASEVAFRAGRRLTPILRPTGVFAQNRTRNLHANERASIDFSGDALVEVPSPVAGPGEIVIAFEALCMIPGDQGRERQMGFTGTVLSAGAGADQWHIGTRLCGLAPRVTRTVAALPCDQISAVCCDESDQPAAVLARLGLVEVPVGRLAKSLDIQAGERALVCQTASGKALANLLERRGVQVTRMGPGATSWAVETLDTGRGEFALIAAPADAFARSFGFNALQWGGHVVDLDPQPSAMTMHERIGSFQRLGARAPGIDTALAADLAESLAEGPLDTGPVESFPLDAWPQANASETGLMLVQIERSRNLEVAMHGQPHFDRHRTYLVTGGLGGLGRHTALWLARHGAGRIVLCGRRGAKTPGTEELLQTLTTLGASGEARALDTGDPDQVESLVAELDGSDQRLAGVFHTAGVLEDKPSLELTAGDIAKVMRPKAGGAWALHRATRDLQLEHFVLYSSMSAIVGNSRQANYCAANGFMDGLAHLRRALGLPATSVNFGAISGAGMAADPRVVAHLRAAGLPPLDIERALAGLGVALTEGLTQVVVADNLDLGRWIKYEARCARTAKMYEIVEPYLRETDDGRMTAMKNGLRGASLEERLNVVSTLLAEIVSIELKLDTGNVSADQSLSHLGVDSLMAIDIQVSIEKAFGTNVSTMVLMGGTTIAGVAAKILAEFGLAGDVPERPARTDHAA